MPTKSPTAVPFDECPIAFRAHMVTLDLRTQGPPPEGSNLDLK